MLSNRKRQVVYQIVSFLLLEVCLWIKSAQERPWQHVRALTVREGEGQHGPFPFPLICLNCLIFLKQ